MATQPVSLPATEDGFVEQLIENEMLYQAARALYERISKDTGWAANPARDVLLDQIVVEGRSLRKVCDDMITDWLSRW